jgi:hypothetical protein
MLVCEMIPLALLLMLPNWEVSKVGHAVDHTLEHGVEHGC